MTQLPRFFFRFIAVWFIQAIALVCADALVPGFSFVATPEESYLTIAVAVALVLGLMNILVRPLLLLLTLPINVLSLGFSTLFVNAGMLLLTSALMPAAVVTDAPSAFFASLVLAFVNTILTGLLAIGDDLSFFQNVVERLSRTERALDPHDAGRGIVMLEIDGLSHALLQRAVERGVMPTVREMIASGEYAVARVDCGVPSQTSSCQAGILFGDNFDIPAFRWYDKSQQRTIVSNNFRDAAEINARYSRGRGLLRGGSSINNMMAGDAAKSLLTMSTLDTHDEQVKRVRAQDLYLFFVNPYAFTRSLLLTLWDVVIELGEALRQTILNVRPRLNRLHKAYPLVRAVTNVFLRDLGTYLVTLDIIRGMPAIYTTYVGYDEVAHHAGPATSDALQTLRGLDREIRRVRGVIATKAPRPYDLFVLSDHGQAFGATFKQRYGFTLKDFITQHISSDARVAEIEATDAGIHYAAALSHELQNVQGQAIGGRMGRGAIQGARRVVARIEKPKGSESAFASEAVTVCVSGNLAHVYFALRDDRVTVDELNRAHPDLVDALVAHEGIGFVIAFTGDGAPVAFGKNGARHLRTGEITGRDPLSAFGDADLRAAQLLRLAEFPHAGDLIVNSAVFPDGTVAAFEELIGSHGGLGGEQTNAFLLHPAEMRVAPTTNAAEVFAQLNARRGLLPAPKPAPLAIPEISSWSLSTWRASVARSAWRVWINRAARALILDRAAYRSVAGNAFATAPAILIALIASVIIVYDAYHEPTLGVFGEWFNWFVGAAVVYALGRVLGGRGRFAETLRALGFASITSVVLLLTFVPILGTFAPFARTILDLLARWIATQESLKLSGWRAAILPLLGITLIIATPLAVLILAAGTQLTVQLVLLRFGIAVPR
jgi:uncharacterized membrane protein YvlD (DUF360 family)